MKWAVEIYGYAASIYEADTRDKARYRAFLAFRDYVANISFRDFLARGVKVSRHPHGESHQ